MALHLISASLASTERLGELFRTMRDTHGGPAYLSRRELDKVQRDAERMMLRSTDEGGSEADEESFHAASAWAMAQLRDPLAAHLRPWQAVAARERFHGHISLGLTLESKLVRQAAASRWPWGRWRRASIVSSVAAGSAAARAGLQTGDELLEVGGLPISGPLRHEALQVLDEGPEGEMVPITLRAQRASMRTVRLCRRTVPLTTVSYRSVSCRALANGVAHVVTISSFGSTTAAELRSALRQLRSAHVGDVLVFDLRCNEGGLLPEAIGACRMLLPCGAHILSLCKTAPQRVVKSYHRRWYHRCELPMAIRSRPYVVLVNRASASSAEVFAGALAHSGGALVIGTRTYGKGSSQAVVYQTDGHAISFTAYTLAVGQRGRHRVPLSEGVEPHMPWRWRAPRGVRVAADAEIERVLQASAMHGKPAATAR